MVANDDVTFGLHLIRRYIGLHRFFFIPLTPPTSKTVYNTIYEFSAVRYDL